MKKKHQKGELIMTEEEREELERLREERDQEELKYYKEENRLREAWLRRQRIKRKLTIIELCTIGIIILFAILSIAIIPCITRTITVDMNQDGFYETKTVLIWQVDKFKEFMLPE